MGVKIPATGTGDTTPTVATEKIGGADFQFFKLMDGSVGGSQGAVVDVNGNLKVSGYLGASVGGYLGASVANLPGTQPINIASYSVTQPVSIASSSITQPVSGYLGASVANFPATQPVSGYLGASIANQPGTQPINIASYSVTQPVSIASSSVQIGASIANFPATQAISIAATLPISIASTSIQVGASVSNTVTVNQAAAATGGASPYHFISGASFNGVNVKSSAGTLYTFAAMNINSSPRYVRLFDKSTQPSAGVDVPVQTYVVPGNAAGAGAVFPAGVGLLFNAGIGFDITGGSMGDTDATTTSLGDVVLNLGFK